MALFNEEIVDSDAHLAAAESPLRVGYPSDRNLRRTRDNSRDNSTKNWNLAHFRVTVGAIFLLL